MPTWCATPLRPPRVLTAIESQLAAATGLPAGLDFIPLVSEPIVLASGDPPVPRPT
jgi:hypothetical protein